MRRSSAPRLSTSRSLFIDLAPRHRPQNPPAAGALRGWVRRLAARCGVTDRSMPRPVAPGCRLFLCGIVALLFLAACAEPPNKEMDQAQGAIDAARAAGADRYAPEEYKAAVDTLAQARDAVAQGDYRLALNHALASREHAQNAAREAAGTRAQLRGDVERAMAEVAALLARANAMVDTARTRRPRAANLRNAERELARVNDDVQKAGAAIQAEDYMTAQKLLTGIRTRIETVIAAVEKPAAAQSSRRRG